MVKLNSQKNPRRVAAGKANRQLRGGLSAGGRQRLREAIQRTQPWLSSTGPKSEAGKKRSAENGRLRQRGERSVRQRRQDLADVEQLVQAMRLARQAVTGPME